MRKIFTHQTVDLDAVLSVCVLWRFVKGMREAEVEFRLSNWDGEGIGPLDVVVDMEAGGRGIKGRKESGTVHSCFALLMERYAPTEIYKSLRNLVEYVDLQDSTGNAVNTLFPNADNRSKAIISSVSILSVFYALREGCSSDLDVVNAFYPIFSGMVRIAEKRIEEIKTIQVEYINGSREVVLLLSDGETQLPYLLGRGVQLVVYSNNTGLGVIRNSKSSKVAGFHVGNLPGVRAVVEAAGEEFGNALGKWFSHDSGFLFARGTRTGPAPDKSKVDPMEFTKAVLAAWEEYKSSQSAG